MGAAWVCGATSWGGTLVEAQLYAGNTAVAIEMAESAAMASPADIDAQELFIDLLLSSGLGRRAERIYSERVAADPTNANTQYLVGRAATTGEGAAKAYEKALRFDPDHARSHMGMAAVHMANGDHPAAARAYFRSINLDPKLSEAWLGLIRAELAMGLTDDALDLAAKGLKHVPMEPGLYLVIAELNPKEARRVLEAASARGVDDPRLLSALAVVLLSEGDVDGALVKSRHALAIDRTHVEATRTALFAAAVTSGTLDIDGYKRLSAARELQATDSTSALTVFDALVLAYPECALTWLGRSQIKRTRGDVAGAVEDSATAAALAPGNVEVEASHGLLLIEVGRHADAAPFLRMASESRPWDSSLGLGFAAALSGAGEAADAAVVLEVLNDMHPHDVRIIITYGQALVDSGRAEAAYKLVRDAVKRVPDPRLAVAMVMTATAAKHYGEAAAILEQLADQTGRKSLADGARRLRELEEGG
jgi:tetratricopeptide (TPR) repeat protein